MNPMTPALLEHLTADEVEMLERANAATPGPWATRFLYRSAKCARNHAREDGLLLDGSSEQDWKDCDFTAHAITDLPELLRRLAEARREVADCQAAYRDERHELRGR